MRLFLSAIFLFGTLASAEAASVCGPEPEIRDKNLETLLDASAKSYAKSSSKDNVLLQALARDPSYFKKIFPRRGRATVGEYYFSLVCRKIEANDGSKGVLTKLSQDKLKYIALAFKYPPATKKVLSELSQNPAAADDAGGFGQTVVNPSEPEKAAPFATTVKSAENKEPPKEEVKEPQKETKTEAAAPTVKAEESKPEEAASKSKIDDRVKPAELPTPKKMAEAASPPAQKEEDASSGEGEGQGSGALPAVAPMSISQQDLFSIPESSGNKSDKVDDTETATQETESPEEKEQVATAETAKQEAEDKASDAKGASGATAEIAVDTGAVELAKLSEPKLLKTPSCGELGITDSGGCAQFNKAISSLKNAKLVFDSPQEMLPGQKTRVSLTLDAEQDEITELFRLPGWAGSDADGAQRILTAELAGKHMQITPRGPQTRVLRPFAPVKWTWFVTPAKDAKGHNLTLDFGAQFPAGGRTLSPIDIKSYRRDIAIESDLLGTLSAALGGVSPVVIAICAIALGLIAVLPFAFGILSQGSQTHIPRSYREPPMDADDEFLSPEMEEMRHEATLFLVSDNNRAR